MVVSRGVMVGECEVHRLRKVFVVIEREMKLIVDVMLVGWIIEKV